MMFSLFHGMSKAHPVGAAPSSGVEESKFENAGEPSAEELRDYRLRSPDRQPFLAGAPKKNSLLGSDDDVERLDEERKQHVNARGASSSLQTTSGA